MAKKLNRTNKVSKDQLRSSIKNRFTGSGVGAIIPKNVDEAIAKDPEGVVRDLSNAIAEIPIEQIQRNPEQPRVDFEEDALAELSASIKEHGLIQPVTVRRLDDKNYQLISGERRWRAAQRAGLEALPTYIRVVENDQHLLEMALIENIQREDLNAIEVAISYHRLKEECKLTDEALAQRVGKRRSTITNHLRLLKLSPDIQQAVKDKEISFSHARELAGVDDIAIRRALFQECLRNGLSVKGLVARIAAFDNPGPGSTAKKSTALTPEYAAVEQRLREHFGTKRIQLKLKGEGKGQILMPFNSVSELNRLLDALEE